MVNTCICYDGGPSDTNDDDVGDLLREQIHEEAVEVLMDIGAGKPEPIAMFRDPQDYTVSYTVKGTDTCVVISVIDEATIKRTIQALLQGAGEKNLPCGALIGTIIRCSVDTSAAKHDAHIVSKWASTYKSQHKIDYDEGAELISKFHSGSFPSAAIETRPESGPLPTLVRGQVLIKNIPIALSPSDMSSIYLGAHHLFLATTLSAWDKDDVIAPTFHVDWLIKPLPKGYFDKESGAPAKFAYNPKVARSFLTHR